MSNVQGKKVAIVGAGGVGTAIAYAGLIKGVARRIALYDVNRAKVEAEVLDLNHGVQFVPVASVEGGDDVGVCAGADVVVITAGAKQKPGQTRLDLASANVGLCRKMVPELMRVAPEAVLLIVTNPVDVVTYAVAKMAGLPAGRVLGSGTVLDSSRFRYLIAERCRVAVQNVHAYIAGEHGDSEVPLWSSAAIGNVPLSEWAVPGHGKLTVRDRTDIFQGVKNAAYKIIEGKGATNLAIGLATAEILQAILRDERRVLPVSTVLNDYRGISDVCLSVPTVVGARGAGAVLPIPMNENEVAGMRNSAEVVRKTIGEAGVGGS